MIDGPDSSFHLRKTLARLDLPMPLEALVYRVQASDEHADAIALWEAGVQVMASACWAVCVAEGLQSKGLAKACQCLGRPSFGHWAGLLREASSLLHAAEGPGPARMRPLIEGL